MRTKKTKHITVKGNGTGVAVRIYVRERTKGGKRYSQFDVVEWIDGRRKFISFADEERAREKAKMIASRLAPPEFGVMKLVGDERVAYETAVNALRAVGAKLDVAAIEYADAKSKLGSVSLSEAVSFYLRQNPTTLPSMTVSQAVEEMIAAKKADGASPIYLKDLKFRLGKFSDSFNVQLSSVSPEDINGFLRACKGSPRGRNNYRLAVVTLFNYAESTGRLHKGHIDFDKVAKAKENPEEIEIFTPDELSKLLTASQLDPDKLKPGFNKRYAGGRLLPYLVLGAFAGLRTAEIERQRWEDILLDRGFIRVTGAKGNTAQKRLVPIGENLKQWLALFKQSAGLVSEVGRTSDCVARLAKRAGVEWKHNALRHSYISYRVAQTQDVAKVSLEAGNTPKMIHRHYREIVTPGEAKTWFSISPGAVPNVVSIAV